VSGTFILGLGAQKAATTWLYSYFLGRPDFVPGLTKEYHVFDWSPAKLPLRTSPVRRYLHRTLGLYADRQQIPLESLRTHPHRYFNHFQGLLRQGTGPLCGDFTPAYGGLPAKTLAHIRDGFDRLGIRVVPVFVMRDPVTRLQSRVRMSFRLQGEQPTRARELDRLINFCGAPEDARRSNYPATLAAIDRVFGDSGYIGFFETLFDQAEIQRLCDALDIPFHPPDLAHIANATHSAHVFTEDDLAPLRAHYKPVYDQCRDRFGATFIDQIWGPGAAPRNSNEAQTGK